MDRKLVYPGSIPLDADVLAPQQNTMIALGFLMQALVGSNTVFSGLGCIPTTPASLSVQVQPGAVISLQALETTPFGSISSDTTDQLVKMGINTSATTFSFTAPTTAGQSQCYLIQASFSESDSVPNVLAYYNSANPSQPFAGAGNSGTPQNTARIQRVNLQVKVGAAATAGSQQTPAVDTGYFGLWVVTLQTGQSSITQSSITPYPNAPFLSALTASHHYGTPGNAPKVHLDSEVQGVLAYANMAKVRPPCISNLTLFVSATGNDSNNGLSSATAFRTIQAAVDAVYRNYDWAGFSATIQVADGTYTAGALFTGMPPGHTQAVKLVGNPSSPNNAQITVTNGNGVVATGGAVISLNGFRITASGTGGSSGLGVSASTMGSVSLSNVNFSSCGSAQTQASAGSIVFTGPCSFSGTSPCAVGASGNGTIYAAGATLTVQAATFTTAFAFVQLCSAVSFGGASFSGIASGPRYLVASNGVITTNGGGPNFLPGDAAGSSSNGLYV